MGTLPPEPIPGAEQLGEVRLYEAPFDPCFDLLVDGAVLATLFYDDKPEAAYAEVDIEDEEGEIRRVPGAEAGLDEDEVGWCLQFTDDPRNVSVLARVPSSWTEHALATAWLWLAGRIADRGF